MAFFESEHMSLVTARPPRINEIRKQQGKVQGIVEVGTWPAGWGLNDIMRMFLVKAHDIPIQLEQIHGTFGLSTELDIGLRAHVHDQDPTQLAPNADAAIVSGFGVFAANVGWESGETLLPHGAAQAQRRWWEIAGQTTEPPQGTMYEIIATVTVGTPAGTPSLALKCLYLGGD